MASPRSRAESIDARRREVHEQLANVELELTALRRTREGLSDDDEHDPDGVPLSAQWSRLEGLKQMKLEALAAIHEAEARLARGEDGRCRVCGRPIASARLAARPEATTCIDCTP
ncbi:TraR/DksA C4-type zinc finger protein [uncultured Brachybacterium sp.]|uniref:TraR/DksA family transcriptional regulator n=1 Tax=uncultured Brachybacterium sp. TaxID=189680 RepID=UPI002622279D|nr:TraR/DksA C4-type zinc finger protein [uncultured Brachybacterium sp.]